MPLSAWQRASLYQKKMLQICCIAKLDKNSRALLSYGALTVIGTHLKSQFRDKTTEVKSCCITVYVHVYNYQNQ